MALQFPGLPNVGGSIGDLLSQNNQLASQQQQIAAQRLANAKAAMDNQAQSRLQPTSIMAQIAQNQAASDSAPLDVASKRAALTQAQYGAAHPLLTLAKDFGSSPVGQVLLAHTLPSAIASLNAGKQAPQPAAVDSVGPLATGLVAPSTSSSTSPQNDIAQQMLSQINVSQQQKAASAKKNTAQSQRGWLSPSLRAYAIKQQLEGGTPLGTILNYTLPGTPASSAASMPSTSAPVRQQGAASNNTGLNQDTGAEGVLQNIIDKAGHTSQQTQGMVTANKALTALNKARDQVMLAHKYFSPMGKALYNYDQIKNPNDPAVLAYKMYNSDMASAKGDIAASMGIKGTDEANKEFQPLFDINNWRTNPQATQTLFNNMIKNVEDETKTNVGTISENKEALANAKFPYVSDSDVAAVSPGSKAPATKPSSSSALSKGKDGVWRFG